jgi:hypothetical protein
MPRNGRRALMASLSERKVRLAQRRGDPDLAGWSRPVQRPASQCPICWQDLTPLAWVDYCPRCFTTLRRD